MKAFVIILVLCFADILFAMVVREKRDDDDALIEGMVNDFAKTCFTENGLDAELVDIFNNPEKVAPGKLPPENKLNCAMGCVYKKVGLLSADGTVPSFTESEEKIAEWTPEAKVRCTKEAKGDVCKLAGCLEETHQYYV